MRSSLGDAAVIQPPNSALHRTWSRNLLHPKCATISRRGSKPVSLDPLGD
jgi:hypothetical protein